MDKQTAYRMGIAFARGCAFNGMALDATQTNKETGREERWSTVHPNGKENKGQPVLIDDETGEVQGGMGGKFNGMSIKEVSKQVPKEQRYKNVDLFGGQSAMRRNPNAVNLRTLNGLDDRQKIEKLLGISAFKDEQDRARVQQETKAANASYLDWKEKIEAHKQIKPSLYSMGNENPEYAKWSEKWDELIKNRDDSYKKWQSGKSRLNESLYKKISVAEANKWNHKADSLPIKIADGKAVRAIVNHYRKELDSVSAGNTAKLKALYKAAFELTPEDKYADWVKHENHMPTEENRPIRKLHSQLRKISPSASLSDAKAILPLVYLYGNKNRKWNAISGTNPVAEVNREVAEMYRKNKVTKGEFVNAMKTLKRFI